jgi:hypothetical protein
MPDEIKQFSVEVLRPRRHYIDDDHGHTFLKKGGALGDERAPMLGAILVCRADNLDDGRETTVAFLVVDANLINVLVW